MKLFGGIEGGATHSRLVIVGEAGQMLATTTGLGTNHWMVGIPECARRIADMVERAKEEGGIPTETRLTTLGLSLSGCEQEATNRELETELRNSFPDLADNYVISSDTMGSVYTASPIGGMVIIAGTGSNTLLRNPDGTTFSCGGWGNFLGDEGSAWHISYRAVKIVFDDLDNFQKSPYPVDTVWELIRHHFNVETRLDLLSHCYAKFDKPFFASLCKKIAQAAHEGDQLSKYLFTEAGQYLARSVSALLPKVSNELVSTGDLSIVCVGSVWLSWPLLREGFLRSLDNRCLRFGLKLIRITTTMAWGACYLGADSVKCPLPRHNSANLEIMDHVTSKNIAINGVNGTNGVNGINGVNGVNGVNGKSSNCECNEDSS